jgi:hypothetical protein
MSEPDPSQTHLCLTERAASLFALTPQWAMFAHSLILSQELTKRWSERSLASSISPASLIGLLQKASASLQCMQDSLAEQGKPSFSVHLPLDEL